MKMKIKFATKLLAIPASLLLWQAPVFAADCASPCRVFTGTVPEVFLDDTSAGATDWEIETQGNGATFEIGEKDFDGIFKIEDNAQVNLLTLDSLNRIGVRTTAPSHTMHVVGNRIRLQNGVKSIYMRADGAATDIEAVGDDLFLRSSSIGSNVILNPFLNDGLVGIGTSTPQAPLHVSSGDNKSAKIKVENPVAPTAAGDVVMYELKNAGPKIVRFLITADGSTWTFDNAPAFNGGSGVNSGKFRISKGGTFVEEFSVDGFGNGRFFGRSYATQHINTSSRTAKQDFKVVNEREILEKLAALPITTWKYKSEESPLEHMGPVAEEFKQVFGLGDGKHISTVDTSGIAFAAIKGLNQKNSDLEKTLNAKVETLETRNQALETALSKKHQQLDALLERVASLEKLVISDEIALR